MKTLSFVYVLILLILLGCMIATCTASADYLEDPASVVSEYKNVEAMWNLVEEYSPNDFITSAVVTQIWYESCCQSNVVGGCNTVNYSGIHDYSEYITAEIDKGLVDGSTREAFITHRIDEYPCWGYGLIQWVEPAECEKLYDYAREYGTSIGDAEMQISFIFDNMRENFPEVWENLQEADNVGDAAVIFAHFIGGTYEGPKLDDRRWKANELLKEYGEVEEVPAA